jgi:hypothetical protein
MIDQSLCSWINHSERFEATRRYIIAVSQKMHHSDEALYPSICSQPVAGEAAVTIAGFYAESCSSMRTPLGLHQRAQSSMWGYRRHTPSANDIA